MPALSVNHWVGAGGTSSASAGSAAANSNARTKTRARVVMEPLPRCGRRGVGEIEVHFRSRAAAGYAFEVRARFEAAHAGNHARGETTDGRVVSLQHLVVALALDADAILRSFELRLQFEEVLIRLQF